MKQKNVYKRWSATSPSILPALSNMSVLVVCGMKLTELAKELDADVVVIGSRNPSISTHLLGSNASSVIRHANLPVLVVR